MTFQYASDLHLEFPQNMQHLRNYPIEPVADILILAGDIVPFKLLDKRRDFFDYLSDHFHQVYWVPGNHEYYYDEITDRSGKLNEQIKPNVQLINNTAIEGADYELIFSTMWSRIDLINKWKIAEAIADFKVIRYNGGTFLPEHFNMLHHQSIYFITEALKNSTKENKIVISHHVPTMLNYPQQYLGSMLNQAFAVELTELILNYEPSHWIYGHHHSNSLPFLIGKTKLLTNQLGYVSYGEQTGYSNKATFSL